MLVARAVSVCLIITAGLICTCCDSFSIWGIINGNRNSGKHDFTVQQQQLLMKPHRDRVASYIAGSLAC